MKEIFNVKALREKDRLKLEFLGFLTKQKTQYFEVDKIEGNDIYYSDLNKNYVLPEITFFDVHNVFLLERFIPKGHILDVGKKYRLIAKDESKELIYICQYGSHNGHGSKYSFRTTKSKKIIYEDFYEKIFEKFIIYQLFDY